MSNGTRIDPEEREPRAIKIGGRKPKHRKRKFVLFALAAICVVAIGVFAFIMFGDSIELPKLPFSDNGESSSRSESVPEVPSESSSSVNENEPQMPSSSNSSSLPESSSSESEPSAENNIEDPVEVKPLEAEWFTLLVNKENPLPEDFSVDTAAIDDSNHAADARIVPELKAMIEAGESEGLSFIFYTAYRSVAKQKELFDAGKTTAAPGTSEHNSGLAVDIGSARSADFTGSAEEAWLLAHAHEYGFVLRYPKDKENITGFAHEPWHFRYVGKDLAKYMVENNLCLEECSFE